MISKTFLSICSDVISVYSSIIFTEIFGVSNPKNKIYILKAMGFTIILSSLLFFVREQKLYFIPVIIYPLMFIIPHVLAFGKVKAAQAYIMLLTEFTSILFSSCITSFISQYNISSYETYNLICVFFVRLIILVASFRLKYHHQCNQVYTISKSIPKYIFFLIISILIYFDFLIVFNNYPQENRFKKMASSFLIILITISLILMIFSLLINVASRNYYTALNSLLEKQVEAQINHYEKLEELNSDIRQLRHDYINHLTSVSTLIEHKNYPDALQYIERLTEATHCNETIYRTGNHLADAILTGKSIECKEFADIEFNGFITDKIDNTDMCAILANALDNAIEACRKCSSRSKINIVAQNKQGYWVMTMRNPTVSEDSKGLMKTSKEDTQNHGFGLLSIEQAVKRYDGNIKVGVKNGVFEISVVVKNQETANMNLK